MLHLPWTHGATYLNELRAYVLLKMSGIKHSSQLELLSLPSIAESRRFYSLHFRWKADWRVLESVSRIVVPRSNEIIKYLCRTSDCFEWIKRREIRDLTPGMIIDFQDAFKVWRRAIILKIFTDKNQKRVVDVKTLFKGTEIVETVEINSKRLAPLNFFTKAKYLEEFAPTLPEYHFHEKELEEL